MVDIEARLISWLDANLDCTVSADVPATRPASFVTVERTGGGKDSIVIDRATVAIQCWAPTRREAASLAYEVDDMLGSFLDEDGIYKVTRNSLYNFPDENGHVGRYQLFVEIVTV